MGTSKAMMERVIVAKSRTVDHYKIKIIYTRYRNVIASRDTVILLFISQINSGNPLTVTEPTMTRFIMALEAVVVKVLTYIKQKNLDVEEESKNLKNQLRSILLVL